VLPPLPSDPAALAPPWLPSSAAELLPLAPDAGAASIPVRLNGAPAACLRVARALHAAAARPGPLLALTGRRPSFDDLPAGATLYVDVTALAREAAVALAAILDDGLVWVIAAVDPERPLPALLAARLDALTADVPALSARPGDLPALAAAIVDRLSARAGRLPVALTPGALAALAAQPFPGDVVELEAVLRRAWLRARGGAIDAGHLDASAQLDAGAPAPAAAATPPAAPPLPDTGPHLELLLAELAHELRNPLVTIKTFAGHLPALLEDAELRERFKTLTDDAIARMDGLLENVLEFARLAPPRREPVDLQPLLDRLLGEVEPELAQREVHVRRTGAAARVGGDAEHLTYALRNLFAGVVREVPPREDLLLDTSVNGVVTVQFAAGGEAATRLRELATPADNERLVDPTLLPLPFTLARAALERSGGGLAVVPKDDGTTALVVRLPAAEEAQR
jgi:signal transduction histidine kinase